MPDALSGHTASHSSSQLPVFRTSPVLEESLIEVIQHHGFPIILGHDQTVGPGRLRRIKRYGGTVNYTTGGIARHLQAACIFMSIVLTIFLSMPTKEALIITSALVMVVDIVTATEEIFFLADSEGGSWCANRFVIVIAVHACQCGQGKGFVRVGTEFEVC